MVLQRGLCQFRLAELALLPRGGGPAAHPGPRWQNRGRSYNHSPRDPRGGQAGGWPGRLPRPFRRSRGENGSGNGLQARSRAQMKGPSRSRHCRQLWSAGSPDRDLSVRLATWFLYCSFRESLTPTSKHMLRNTPANDVGNRSFSMEHHTHPFCRSVPGPCRFQNDNRTPSLTVRGACQKTALFQVGPVGGRSTSPGLMGS